MSRKAISEANERDRVTTDIGVRSQGLVISSADRVQEERPPESVADEISFSRSIFQAHYVVPIPRIRATSAMITFGVFSPPFNITTRQRLWFSVHLAGPTTFTVNGNYNLPGIGPLLLASVDLLPNVYSTTDLALAIQDLISDFLEVNTTPQTKSLVRFSGFGNRLSMDCADVLLELCLYDEVPSFYIPGIPAPFVSNSSWTRLGFSQEDDSFLFNSLVIAPTFATHPPPLISKCVKVAIQEFLGSNSIAVSSGKIIGGINAVIPINNFERTTTANTSIFTSRQMFSGTVQGKRVDSLHVTVYDETDEVAVFQDDHLIGLVLDSIDQRS